MYLMCIVVCLYEINCKRINTLIYTIIYNDMVTMGKLKFCKRVINLHTFVILDWGSLQYSKQTNMDCQH